MLPSTQIRVTNVDQSTQYRVGVRKEEASTPRRGIGPMTLYLTSCCQIAGYNDRNVRIRIAIGTEARLDRKGYGSHLKAAGESDLVATDLPAVIEFVSKRGDFEKQKEARYSEQLYSLVQMPSFDGSLINGDSAESTNTRMKNQSTIGGVIRMFYRQELATLIVRVPSTTPRLGT